MKERILENLRNPEELERLYRGNKPQFSKSLAEVPDENSPDLLRFWKIRLAPDPTPARSEYSAKDLAVMMALALFSGLLARIPAMFPLIPTEFFYTRNLAIIIFNGIILYTFWQNRIFDRKRILLYAAAILLLLIFINLLPDPAGDSVNLALIHAPLSLWCLFGLAFVSFEYGNTSRRIEFIRFNGEFLIMTGLILIAGGMMTGITLGLFSAIKMDISRFYMEDIALPGAVVAPVVSLYLLKRYPNMTSRIAPVIARVFTPLVLLTLAVYLVSLIFSESRILEDRDLLILFNGMLLAVMAIIVFSVSELDKSRSKDFNVLVLFCLSVLAIIINAIVFSAIITRVGYGLTPNRTVVLISNLLIFGNLILISRQLFRTYFMDDSLDGVEQAVAKYLTVYALWTLVVVFVLPFVFQFR
jgi:hypothetical protein